MSARNQARPRETDPGQTLEMPVTDSRIPNDQPAATTPVEQAPEPHESDPSCVERREPRDDKNQVLDELQTLQEHVTAFLKRVGGSHTADVTTARQTSRKKNQTDDRPATGSTKQRGSRKEAASAPRPQDPQPLESEIRSERVFEERVVPVELERRPQPESVADLGAMRELAMTHAYAAIDTCERKRLANAALASGAAGAACLVVAIATLIAAPADSQTLRLIATGIALVGVYSLFSCQNYTRKRLAMIATSNESPAQT